MDGQWVRGQLWRGVGVQLFFFFYLLYIPLSRHISMQSHASNILFLRLLSCTLLMRRGFYRLRGELITIRHKQLIHAPISSAVYMSAEGLVHDF